VVCDIWSAKPELFWLSSLTTSLQEAMELITPHLFGRQAAPTEAATGYVVNGCNYVGDFLPVFGTFSGYAVKRRLTELIIEQ
jgi:hypothetical protein